MTDIPAFTPVHLLTGFLGSGKTTLLKRLLADPALADTAILINEFGEVGLDHHLVERIDETMVLLQSGCVCCTVRGELADALRDLHAKRDRGLVPAFTRVVIESTGLADPFPVLSTLKSDPVLRHHFRAGSVVATVDAVNGLSQLDTYVESSRQVAIADRLVITKADIREGEAGLSRLLVRLGELNPDAQRTISGEGHPDAESLFGDDVAPQAAKLQSPSGFYCDVAGDGAARHKTISSFVVTVEEPIDWTGFGVWLTMLLNRHGDRILRVKGILALSGEDRPVAVHGVQHLVHPPVHLAAWPSSERVSRLVFIVDGIDANLLIRSFNAFALAGNAKARPRSEAAVQIRNAQSP